MGRAVRYAVVVMSLLVSWAGMSVAAVPPDPSADQSPWDGPAAAEPATAELLDDPVFKASMAQALARHLALESERATDEAEAERELSRTRFDGLSSEGARALALREFPALMTAEHDELRLPLGDHITGLESAYAATAVDADGEESVVLSSEPLAVHEDGRLRPVDLGLVPVDGAYEPVRAAVDVSLPQVADGYVRVGEEALGARPTDGAPVAGTLANDRVFYADISTDTDYVAVPTRAGAEVMWQLRSPAAPERLGLDLDLPEGATVRIASTTFSPGGAVPPGDVEIVAADGTALGTITAPVAVAADGADVPAAFRFVDGELVVEVEHRGSDLAYPVLVDPEVRDVWGSWEFNQSCGGGPSHFMPGEWTYQQWVTIFNPICGNGDGWGNGLFVQSGIMPYTDTAHGQWIWSPPAGSYIMSVWFDGMRHLAAGTHMYTGLFGQAWGSLANHYSEFTYGQYTHYPNSPWNSWAAVFGLWMDGSYYRPHIGLAAVRGVNIRLGDLDPPIVQLASITGGLDAQTRTRWFDDAVAPAQVSVRAIDGGLGLKTIEVVRDVTGARVAGSDHYCLGHRSSPCPRSWTLTTPLGQLPEGLNSIQTRARDIVDNQHSGPHWVQRIDRSAPEITLSGELVDHATDGQLGPNPSIFIHARDGSLASPATHRSGVKRVRLLLDGNVREDYVAPEGSCDNCDRGLTWSIPAPALVGQHTVKVEAWDYLNHYASRTLTITGSGGVNGVLDTFDEVSAFVDAMAATTSTGRQALWANLSQASRDYYIDSLLPDARQVRKAFDLDASDAATRSVFSDPTTHGTIAEYGAPMTSTEWAIVSDESPPSWVYDGPPNADVLASTYSVRTDDGGGGPDSTGNVGCDPTMESGCPDSATILTSALTTSSDPVTDDLNAIAGAASSQDALRAGAASSRFDRYRARADADDHALVPRTGLYEPFGNADCTNFVSQVWHLGGGLPMKLGWRIRFRRRGGQGARSYTRSWTLVREFVDYMVNDRQTSRLINADITSFDLPSQAAIADAVEYDWGEGEGWSHLAVVVKTNTGLDHISQHSENRRQSLWNFGWVDQRSLLIKARMKARIVHLRAP